MVYMVTLESVESEEKWKQHIIVSFGIFVGNEKLNSRGHCGCYNYGMLVHNMYVATSTTVLV